MATGEPPSPGNGIRHGIDEAAHEISAQGTVNISGWCFHELGQPLRGVRARVGSAIFVAQRKQMRPSVAHEYPGCVDKDLALHSGFSVQVQLPSGTSVVQVEYKDVQGQWRELARLSYHIPHPIVAGIGRVCAALKKLMRTFRRRPRIRVGILSCGKDEFCHLFSLYEAFLGDLRFEPYAVPYGIHHPDTGYASDSRKHAEFLQENNMRLLRDDNPPELKVGAAQHLRLEDMDVLITFLPYEGLLEPAFRARVMSRPLCYVPYGALVNHVAYGNPFYDACWRIFVDHPTIKERFAREKGAAWAEARCVVAGLPKLDGYQDRRLKTSGYWAGERTAQTRRVLILDHWTLEWNDPDTGTQKWQGYSQFHKYKDLFLELPGRYPLLDFVFRPHPLLFDNLIKAKLFTADELASFVRQFEAYPNTKYDQLSQDYILVFKESDCLIASGISCWVEYLPSQKPILMLEKEDGHGLNEYGASLLAGHYRAKGPEDIYAFLEDVVLGGRDHLREARLSAMKQHLLLPAKGAGISIKDHILQAILRERAAPTPSEASGP